MSVRASGLLPMQSMLPNKYIVATPHDANSEGLTAISFVCNEDDLMLSVPRLV